MSPTGRRPGRAWLLGIALLLGFLFGALPAAAQGPDPALARWSRCYACHVGLEEPQAEVARAWAGSVHARAQVGCADCHGGDRTTDRMDRAMGPGSGFLGVPSSLDVPRICGGCHADVERMRPYGLATDPYAAYRESAHGKALEAGDVDVATCADCHGAHAVRSSQDPSAPTYPLNVPDLCARCHANPALMGRYGLPASVYDAYRLSVHGRALLDGQDLRAPSCAGCHGAHGAAPPGVRQVVDVCGRCHAAIQRYYERSRHAEVPDGPLCVTCHGTHDIAPADEALFRGHPEIGDRSCAECHRHNPLGQAPPFPGRRPRACNTCHLSDSFIGTQVQALETALRQADLALQEARTTLRRAAAQGLLVAPEEIELAEAHTSLVQARAAMHSTRLPEVGRLAEQARVQAIAVRWTLDEKIARRRRWRRQAILAALLLGLTAGALYGVKRDLEGGRRPPPPGGPPAADPP